MTLEHPLSHENPPFVRSQAENPLVFCSSLHDGPPKISISGGRGDQLLSHWAGVPVPGCVGAAAPLSLRPGA